MKRTYRKLTSLRVLDFLKYLYTELKESRVIKIPLVCKKFNMPPIAFMMVVKSGMIKTSKVKKYSYYKWDTILPNITGAIRIMEDINVYHRARHEERKRKSQYKKDFIEANFGGDGDKIPPGSGIYPGFAPLEVRSKNKCHTKVELQRSIDFKKQIQEFSNKMSEVSNKWKWAAANPEKNIIKVPCDVPDAEYMRSTKWQGMPVSTMWDKNDTIRGDNQEKVLPPAKPQRKIVLLWGLISINF